MKPKIIAHCLVKNEERFIWYALQSVLPYVDQIMVWDTGSDDQTVDIINSIKSKKIVFKQVVQKDADSFTVMRQRMLDTTPKEFTWVMILDGDEIWPKKSIKQVTDFARQYPDYQSIVVRTHNLVGDIYHCLPESAGHYTLAGHTGHLALRFMNRKTIPGLNASRPHGQQGYFDSQGTLIQDRDPDKIKFLDLYYHHATHLQRSSLDRQTLKRAFKRKIEWGRKMSSSQVPQVFFASRPDFVPDVTAKAGFTFWIQALFITPLKIIKRLFPSTKTGY